MWHHALHHNGSRVNAESRNCVRAYRWNTHCRAGNKSPVLPLSFVWMTFSQSFVPFPFFFLSTFFFSPLSLFLSRLMSCSIDRDIFIDKVAPKLCQRWKVCLFFVEEFLIASLRKFYIYIYLGKVLREVGSIVGKWFIEFQEAISSVTKVFDLRNRKFLDVRFLDIKFFQFYFTSVTISNSIENKYRRRRTWNSKNTCSRENPRNQRKRDEKSDPNTIPRYK